MLILLSFVNFGGCFWGQRFCCHCGQEPWACWRGDNFILLMKGCWEGSGYLRQLEFVMFPQLPGCRSQGDVIINSYIYDSYVVLFYCLSTYQIHIDYR